MKFKFLITLIVLFLNDHHYNLSGQIPVPDYSFIRNPQAQRGIPDESKPYHENIYLIANYSDVAASSDSNYSITELLDFKVDGIALTINKHARNGELYLINPDSTFSPLLDEIIQIKSFLELNKNRIFTIFLDIDKNISGIDIASIFEVAGLTQYLYTYNPDDGWPVISNMLESDKRLVIFSRNNINNIPEWLKITDNLAFEMEQVYNEPSAYFRDVSEEDLQKDILIINLKDLFVPETGFQSRDFLSQPYFIELFKNLWLMTGKMPNFIVTGQFEPEMYAVISYLRNYKTVKGTATFNSNVFKRILWNDIDGYTSGKFIFPVLPGENYTLIPTLPGYSFKPDRIEISDSIRTSDINFIANPLDIRDNLEAFYTLDDDAGSIISGKKDGRLQNIVFEKDSIRGYVAHFGNGSLISLPKAPEFNIRDHDFTISAWVLISEYEPDKHDYCILGARYSNYLQGLHLVIRNQKPYMGFYNNDLEGRTSIRSGQWYYITFRYNKLIGEQAIFVNGKLDSRAAGRPPFRGSDSLYVGIEGFDKQNSYMNGYLDDIGIWSRPLSDEEILGLSRQLIPVTGRFHLKNIALRKSWLYIGLPVLVFSTILIYRKFRRRVFIKKKTVEKNILKDEVKEKSQLLSNHIQLFGEFKIYGRSGDDISEHFTPKLKQLFLIIFLNSQYDKTGITADELSEILWKGFSKSNKKNARNVAIRKLRLILENIDKVEIMSVAGRFLIKLSGPVYCDYVKCRELIEEGVQRDKKFFDNFYKIVRKGEFLKGESFDWLDDFKGFISNNIVDILLKYIEIIAPARDSDLITRICDIILLNDPINEEAVSFKMKALVNLNNYNLAHYTYDRFCSVYLEFYGEKYTRSFDQLIV